MTSYSTYEAKAKLSEILRRVRAGESVRITYYGEEIAEVRPISKPERDERIVEELERRGVLEPPSATDRGFTALASRPGALRRFLEDRD